MPASPTSRATESWLVVLVTMIGVENSGVGRCCLYPIHARREAKAIRRNWDVCSDQSHGAKNRDEVDREEVL